MEKLMKYENSRIIFFEPELELPENFIKSKDYCNSTFISHGRFEKYIFNSSNCSVATKEEADLYFAEKDRSVYLIGKI